MPATDPYDPWDEPPDPYNGAQPADEPIEAEVVPAEEVVSPVQCWRCGLVAAPGVGGKCRKCQAKIGPESGDEWLPNRPRPIGTPTAISPALIVIILYAMFLFTSVVWGWIVFHSPGMTEEENLRGTAVVEGIDTLFALIALAMIGRRPLPSRTPSVRLAAWIVAVPVFTLLICGNILYGDFLRGIVRPGLQPDTPPITALTVLLICVQPALVEELFFRYVSFGTLHRATGLHSTVWVTAVMFAAAHIYNPLGMPYLFVVGVVLGYARVWGGLALPMVMHFLHNLAVLAFEGN